MAQGKKSFVAYADWKDVFDELPNEDAGALIKHIFAYVNDENPETNSVLIKAVFANIKSTLKRDLNKWETQLTQRSEAGKRSAELRALTKLNESQRNPTVVNSRERNPTVNDNVNVNVNVNVNDNDIKKPIKPKKVSGELIKNDIIYPFETETFIKNWELWKIYKKEEHNFKYKSQISEGLALRKLTELSKNNEQNAILILNDAISNGYKGFFELKQQSNGQPNKNIRNPEQDKLDFFSKRYRENNTSGSTNDSPSEIFTDHSDVP